MNMQDVVLEEVHHWTRHVNSNSTLLDMASRCVKIVEDLREEHGYDAVIAKKPFRYIQKKIGHQVFFGLEWHVQMDADRIKIEGAPR